MIDALPFRAADVPSAASAADLEGLRGATPAEAAKKFEGLFASLLVSEMKKTLPSGSFFGGGTGADVYDGLLERHLGESLAEGRGFGLADFVERSMEGRHGGKAAP